MSDSREEGIEHRKRNKNGCLFNLQKGIIFLLTDILWESPSNVLFISEKHSQTKCNIVWYINYTLALEFKLQQKYFLQTFSLLKILKKVICCWPRLVFFQLFEELTQIRKSIIHLTWILCFVVALGFFNLSLLLDEFMMRENKNSVLYISLKIQFTGWTGQKELPVPAGDCISVRKHEDRLSFYADKESIMDQLKEILFFLLYLKICLRKRQVGLVYCSCCIMQQDTLHYISHYLLLTFLPVHVTDWLDYHIFILYVQITYTVKKRKLSIYAFFSGRESKNIMKLVLVTEIWC